jgi:1-acyl-sn-glycerol-3-phosphate acyltransferase
MATASPNDNPGIEAESPDADRLAPPLRVGLRVIFLFFWTIGCFTARVAVFPLVPINAVAERTLRSRILRAWAAGVCAIMNARITVHGPVPQAAFYLVSNHLSYVDVIVFARILGCVFVSMAEVDKWPLVGTLARGLNTLFIDRTRRRDTARVNHAIRATLSKGHGLLVFPESTTTYGDTVLPFHGALLQPAIDAQRPVHYAAISYATQPGTASPEPAICWVDDTPFATHALRLLRVRGFNVNVVFGERPLIETDRKRLAASLHAAVLHLVQGRAQH